MELSEKAKEARNKYKREWNKANRDHVNQYQRVYIKKWYKKNPDKVKKYNQDYWERKAKQMNDTVNNEVTVTDNKVTVTAEPEQKECINCGASFVPQRTTARYCSDKCRVSYNRAKNKTETGKLFK